MISAFEARELTKKAKEEDYIQHCDRVVEWVNQKIKMFAESGFFSASLNIYKETYNDKIIFQVISLLNQNGFEAVLNKEFNCLDVSWKEEK